ncbi:hypothetical protein [Pararhizobium antarcticum]|uniref:Uncharacterized protein n=1 Tax=Pararhizobium antarcticum TaxID=1798805 RepID=A0A657LQB8_9HYPH|nr:hypothetical protein [Pararhizobium antarcticum]OJF91803.1 hypothetical protein AX761_21900 [Rhizobium sp. 58]OJF93721.1 hypothetical protein AX760_21380 [Pararhizobium antarcticum]
MKAALVIMTILGCDDSATQCHYISTVEGSWQTVALCDNESQKQLPKFSNDHNYPVIVAVCETAGNAMTATADPEPQPQLKPAPLDTPAVAATAESETRPNLPRRALAFITGALPDTTQLRNVVTKPVHYVEDGYSWVARKFTK